MDWNEVKNLDGGITNEDSSQEYVPVTNLFSLNVASTVFFDSLWWQSRSEHDSLTFIERCQ